MTDSMAVRLPEVSHLQQVFDHVVLAATVVAVTRARVADHLTAAPRPIADVATDAGVDPGALRRLLRVLETEGVVRIDGDAVAGTGLSALLHSGGPFWSSLASVGAFDVAFDLAYSLRTGESAWEHVHGLPFWDWLGDHPEEEATFAASMRDQGSVYGLAAIPHLDLDGVRVLADVGGGTGALLSAVLATPANADVRGILVDLPTVLERADVDADRVTLHPGDLFGEMPAADAYVLSRVLHDWSDEDARRILEGIRRAAAPGARLFDIDLVVPPGPGPHPSKFGDVNMLLLFGGGRERTRDEFEELLTSAGWRLDDVRDLAASGLLTATAV